MRLFLRILLVVSGLAFAVVTAWTLFALDSVKRSLSVPEGVASRDRAVFHFIAVMPAPEQDAYYARARKGIEGAASRARAAVQYFDYRSGEGTESVRRLLALAADVAPDGVALVLPAGTSWDAEVAAIDARGIPVVTLESDQGGARRRAHVGTNAFDLGRLAAETAADRFPSGVRIALLLSGESDAGFVMGFRQVARGEPGLDVALVRTAREGEAAGEELVRSLLTLRPDIGLAVFTAARDAEGAAQALVEYGRVGSLAVIGFDDSPEIRKLVQDGVVLASLARRPERAGEAVVEALATLARNERTSAYVDPGLSLLTADGLSPGRLP